MRSGGKPWRIISFFLPAGAALIRIEDIDVDLNSEEGVTTREECTLLSTEEARTRAVGYLRCEGRPHLHQVMTGRRGREARLSLAAEVEFLDEMETCISAGRALLWSDGGHRRWISISVINGREESFHSRVRRRRPQHCGPDL